MDVNDRLAQEPMEPHGADPDDLPASPPEGFDEARYLRAFGDVAEAVQMGIYHNALQHYTLHGRHEDRLQRAEYLRCEPVVEADQFYTLGIDAVFAAPSGRHVVIGWVNDDQDRLGSLSLMLHQAMLGTTTAIARCRREDAERAVNSPPGRLLGFWAVVEAHPGPASADLRIVLQAGRSQRSVAATVQPVSDERLREIALEYLVHASYFGNPQVEACRFLDGGLGDTLLAMNVATSARVAAAPFHRRFGPARTRFRGSVVVCLYGKSEFLFLQAAFFTAAVDWQGYEFIYVCNSPELADTLLKEAAIAAQIYRISLTIVLLPGNAGFGAANNVAVGFARSGRILITNPDVFPRDADWAVRHDALIDGLPPDRSRFFGAPLFYDDGSLMHGGMFFEVDEGLSVTAAGFEQKSLVRVEHYGKGAPPDTQVFLQPRPVPAVTGAFMSIDRGWFEKLGGFAPEYVFGHYEDADLCLRSLVAGTQVWLQDLPMWHLEGKGSTRRAVHEGGSLVNRWQFTRRWGALVAAEMNGPAAGLAPRAADAA